MHEKHQHHTEHNNRHGKRLDRGMAGGKRGKAEPMMNPSSAPTSERRSGSRRDRYRSRRQTKRRRRRQARGRALRENTGDKALQSWTRVSRELRELVLLVQAALVLAHHRLYSQLAYPVARPSSPIRLALLNSLHATERHRGMGPARLALPLTACPPNAPYPTAPQGHKSTLHLSHRSKSQAHPSPR